MEYDLNMIRYRNFFALVLLVMSLVLTSGATATAMELLQAGDETACCVTDTDSETTPFDAPCSEPGCQCISCLTFVVPMCSYRKMLIAFLAVSVFDRHEKLPPLEYYKSIDYPPEFS